MSSEPCIKSLLDSFPDSREAFFERMKRKFNINSLDECDNSVIFGSDYMSLLVARQTLAAGLGIHCFSEFQADSAPSLAGFPMLPLEAARMSGRRIIVASYDCSGLCRRLSSLGVDSLPYYVVCNLFGEHYPFARYTGAIEAMLRSRDAITELYDHLADDKSKSIYCQLLKFRLSLDGRDLPVQSEDEYYPEGFWKLSDHEVYADIGGYDGDTMLKFLARRGNAFDRYIVVEPSQEAHDELCRRIPTIYRDKILLVCAAAGAGEGTAAFRIVPEATYLSEMNTAGDIRVPLVTLDGLSPEKQITTIKIDSEGYEQEILAGAKNLIKTVKPRLAVSIYHKPWDLWELPLQVLRLNPGYKFYIRHHEPETTGTVLYAV